MLNDYINACLGKRICIVGAGGLGGHIAHMVARLNPKFIRIIDGDHFSESNFNRQLFCSFHTIGRPKASSVMAILKEITTTEMDAYDEFLSEKNLYLLQGFDIIMDATDNIIARKLLQKACDKFHTPIVHGAINELFGQVAIIYPNDKILDTINPTGHDVDIGTTLSYVPAIIASFQVSEMVKYFADDRDALKSNQLMIIDIPLGNIRTLNL